MGFDLNSYSCTARLGSQPEIKTVGENKVANFRIAVGAGKDKKTDKDLTVWLGVTAWGRDADTVDKFLNKGSRAAFSGRLSQREYTNRDGQNVTVTELTVNSITLLDAKGSGPSNDRDGGAQEERKPASRQSAPAEDDMGMDDIPF